MEYFKKRTKAIRKTDHHPYPHNFQTDLTLKEFNSKFNDLSPGEDETVRLAGMYLYHNFISLSDCNYPTK